MVWNGSFKAISSCKEIPIFRLRLSIFHYKLVVSLNTTLSLRLCLISYKYFCNGDRRLRGITDRLTNLFEKPLFGSKITRAVTAGKTIDIEERPLVQEIRLSVLV